MGGGVAGWSVVVWVLSGCWLFGVSVSGKKQTCFRRGRELVCEQDQDQDAAAQPMVDNPKRLAVLAVDATVTASQTGLAGTQYSGVYGGQVHEGLTHEVWTSPVADSFRTRISEAIAKADGSVSSMHTALTNAAASLEEKVPADSSEAKWPNG